MSAARTPGHPVSIPNLGESQCALPSAQHCPECWCSTSRPPTFLDKCRCAQALPCHCRSHLQPAGRPSGRLTSSPCRALVAPFLQLQIFQDACLRGPLVISGETKLPNSLASSVHHFFAEFALANAEQPTASRDHLLADLEFETSSYHYQSLE